MDYILDSYTSYPYLHAFVDATQQMSPVMLRGGRIHQQQGRLAVAATPSRLSTPSFGFISATSPVEMGRREVDVLRQQVAIPDLADCKRQMVSRKTRMSLGRPSIHKAKLWLSPLRKSRFHFFAIFVGR